MRMCKPNWLDAYLEYTHMQESPTMFHYWVALSIIGASVGRNMWIPRVKYIIFPNIFVILIAGSAKCKKSSAINLGKDIISSIDEPPMIFAQKITTEAIIKSLQESAVNNCSSGLVVASELSVFMGSDAIKSGIIPTLTDLYDSPKEWTYHTRGRGKEVLKNVTLSVLAASTPDWLRCSIPADAIGGGFTSRIIFVYQDKPSKSLLFHEETPRERGLKACLIHDLNYIKKSLSGVLKFSAEAVKLSSEWYELENKTTRDEKLDGYFGRKHDIMFKVASLLSLSESDEKVIEERHIKRALDLLAKNEENLGSIIASVVATVVGGDTEKILEIVKRAGVISHTELLRKCWRIATAEAISVMVRTLIESEEVEEFMSTDNRQRFYKIRERKKI